MLKPLEQRRRSLLDVGRVVGTSGLDDFWARWAGLILLVAVIRAGAVAALVFANMDDHTGGGGRGGVELILITWNKTIKITLKIFKCCLIQ